MKQHVQLLLKTPLASKNQCNIPDSDPQCMDLLESKLSGGNHLVISSISILPETDNSGLLFFWHPDERVYQKVKQISSFN